jgi:hypothetical protein
MISKSFIKFIALILIASSLTYSVNAAAMIAPARLARNLLPGSPVTARSNENRQSENSPFGSAPYEVYGNVAPSHWQECAGQQEDLYCLLNGNQAIYGGNVEVIAFCHQLYEGASELEESSFSFCLHIFCPDIPFAVRGCLSYTLGGYNAITISESWSK